MAENETLQNLNEQRSRLLTAYKALTGAEWNG
jgi:hypothetical protein